MPNHSASLLKQILKQVLGTCALTYTRHLQVPFLFVRGPAQAWKTE